MALVMRARTSQFSAEADIPRRMAAHSLAVEDASAVVAERLTFDDVYRTHVAFVCRVVRYLGVPAEAADDAVQDVFVVVHRRFDQFAVGDVRAWLYAIARGVARNHLRSASRAARRKTVDAPPPPAVSRDPDAVVSDAERLQLALSLLHELDEDKRIVFLLMEVEGLSAPEVATMLGLNVNTVYARRRAARLRFGERIRDGR
jgi:RNA polymerase sigma factor (sigma-70 family)